MAIIWDRPFEMAFLTTQSFFIHGFRHSNQQNLKIWIHHTNPISKRECLDITLFSSKKKKFPASWTIIELYLVLTRRIFFSLWLQRRKKLFNIKNCSPEIATSTHSRRKCYIIRRNLFNTFFTAKHYYYICFSLNSST